MEAVERQANFTLAILSLFILGLFAVTAHRLQGPAPKPISAHTLEFSAGRAREVLRFLLADERPHPVGSDANEAIRDRIVSRFRELGYEPSVEWGWGCGSYVSCSEVENIVATLPGEEPGPGVFLVAHYDSVAAGPGTSDDAAAVAALLEIARILKLGPALRHPVYFLITDGEEAGLLGAEAFAAHPLMDRVGVLINLEARGTSGTSFMFETSRGNEALVEAMKSIPRPATSSLFYSIYERLPNDTDFSVFKRYGKIGVNFAFIRDVSRYHTSLDDVNHLSMRSLQHHGDNALALARQFGRSLPAPNQSNAVFFDLFSALVIAWPEPWTIPLTLVVAAGLLVVIVLLLRRSRMTVGQLVLGFLGVVASLVAVAGVSMGVAWVLRLSAFRSDWVPHPAPAIACFVGLAFTVATATATLMRFRSSFVGWWSGTALLWVVLSIVIAAVVPGASYLFLIPSTGFLLAGVFAFRRGISPAVALIIPAVATATVLAPLITTLYDAMGLPIMPMVSLLAALLAVTIAPIVVFLTPPWRAWLLASLASFTLTLLIGSAVQPAYSKESPQRLNLVYHHDVDTETSRLLSSVKAPEMPPSLRGATRWAGEPGRLFPWQETAEYAIAPSTFPPAGTPEMIILSESIEDDRRIVRISIGGQTGSIRTTLSLKDADRVERVRVNGTLVSPTQRWRAERRSSSWLRISIHAGSPGGTEVELMIRGEDRLEGILYDVTPGLPAALRAVQSARPASAVVTQDGDVSIVSGSVRL